MDKNPNTERLFITKYALTDGIQIRDARPYGDGSFSYGKAGWSVFVRLGRDAFRTEEEAMKGAEAARAKKIAHHKKQIAKLEALTFSIPVPEVKS